MRVGRTCLELDASLFFAADETHGAHVLCKKARPKKPPTLNQMIRMVGSLGGFLGRKSDGEPSAKTLWIGMERVMDAAHHPDLARRLCTPSNEMALAAAKEVISRPKSYGGCVSCITYR